MAVSLYFGLPGCGKTTLLAAKALKAVRSKRYKNVYSNVRLAIPGVIYIDNACIGNFQIDNALVLIDEATLFADNRSHKDFPKHLVQFFLLHRHYNVDVILFTQQWNGVDKKIRVITDRVFYVYKGFFTGHWFSCYYRIPYGIIIPDPKRDGSEKLGDIVQGYCKPNLLIRILSHKLYRPKYYKYFDSWEAPELPPLPDQYKPFEKPQRPPKSYFVAFVIFKDLNKQTTGGYSPFLKVHPPPYNKASNNDNLFLLHNNILYRSRE